MTYSIGDLSHRTGVKVPTIRYYEQMGLITAPERSRGNQRRYTKHELERLGFIKNARDMGLSVDSIRDLVRLSAHPQHSCSDADLIAKRHLATIRQRIARLQGLERELDRIVRGCSGENVVSDCYVLRAFGDHTLCDASDVGPTDEDRT